MFNIHVYMAETGKEHVSESAPIAVLKSKLRNVVYDIRLRDIDPKIYSFTQYNTSFSIATPYIESFALDIFIYAAVPSLVTINHTIISNSVCPTG